MIQNQERGLGQETKGHLHPRSVDLPLFEACVTDMLSNDAVERCTFLADVVTAADAANLGVEQDQKLVETSQTMSFVERTVLRQQLGAFHFLLDLLLNSPAFYTYIVSPKTYAKLFLP